MDDEDGVVQFTESGRRPSVYLAELRESVREEVLGDPAFFSRTVANFFKALLFEVVLIKKWRDFL